MAQAETPRINDASSTKGDPFAAMDMTPIDLSHLTQSVPRESSNSTSVSPPLRLLNPGATPDSQVVQANQLGVATRAATAGGDASVHKPGLATAVSQVYQPGELASTGSIQASNTQEPFYHGMPAGTNSPDSPYSGIVPHPKSADQPYQGLLPRTGKADPYYNGAIARTSVLDDLGNVADVVLPAASAVAMHSLIRSNYGANYAHIATAAEHWRMDLAANNLQTVLRRANQPEIDQLTVQMRRIARQVGGNPANQDSWISLNRGVLTRAEQTISNRWNGLMYPDLHQATLPASASSDLGALYRQSATAYESAYLERQTAAGAAEVFRRAMRTGGLAALGFGEAANLTLDKTIFKSTPHSMRTILADTLAPAIVFTGLPWQGKLAVIVGTHVVNRYWDTQSNGVGKF